jgi:hypothetical protein
VRPRRVCCAAGSREGAGAGRLACGWLSKGAITPLGGARSTIGIRYLVYAAAPPNRRCCEKTEDSRTPNAAGGRSFALACVCLAAVTGCAVTESGRVEDKLAESLERDPASAGRPKSVSCDKTELKMQIVGEPLYECNVATPTGEAQIWCTALMDGGVLAVRQERCEAAGMAESG